MNLSPFLFSGASKGKKLSLGIRPTAVTPFYGSEQDYKDRLAADVAELSGLQELLFSSGQTAVLLIFQGMDAAGKDGAVRHVLSGINPAGCEVHSFKQPSAEERQHDFLWRTIEFLPARGRIGVFNRSYYEEVLVVRVHPELLKSEGIVAGKAGLEKVWDNRYRSLVDFERHLQHNGTRIVKFFLHLSKEEQRKRFLERIDEPDKNWKFSQDDIAERDHWDQYQQAYQECLDATGTESAPWYIVPADDKLNARLIVSNAVIKALKDLSMTYPEISQERKAQLLAIRRQLDP